MPELPEVEVTRLGLLPLLCGRRVVKISSSRKRLRSHIPRKKLQENILGDCIRTIDRRAKYLLFRMAGGAVLVIHLGMTGKLSMVPAREALAKHDHLRIRLDNGMELRLNDSRRFGIVLVWPVHEAATLEKDFAARLGVEPFSRKFTAAYLRKLAATRKLPMKNFLMDPRIVSGIGNIYANEILYAAGIHPQVPAQSVSEEQWRKVVTATRRILKKAIRSGGSTISDFLGSSGNPGYFQIHFNVYNRAGESCRQCPDQIGKVVLGGRTTFFCPCCQPRLNNG